MALLFATGWWMGAGRGGENPSPMIERPGDEFGSTDLRLSPGLDPYRDDPRFAELVERRERFEAEDAKLGEAGRPWLP